MSGLASKWATEEELVNRANTQDNESRKYVTPKSTIPNKNDTPKPLESKWANTSSEPANTATHKDNRNRFDDSSKYNRSGKKNRGRNDRNHGNEAYGSLPSPPSTAERDTSPNNSNDSHVPRAGSGNTPRGPRAYQTSAKNRQGKYATNKKVDHAEESEEEKSTPMSKAGASFAARLGVPSKKTENATTNGHKDDFESTDEEITDEEDDGFEDTQDTPESEDEKEEILPPITSAGQSLASRLGMVSISNTKSDPPKPKQNVKQTQLKPRQSNDPPRQTKTPKGAYQTPKQKREEQVRKEQAEKERLQKQKDAKLKEEVRDMFSKLTSSSANWADLEDED
jgi:hypothetical protein